MSFPLGFIFYKENKIRYYAECPRCSFPHNGSEWVTQAQKKKLLKPLNCFFNHFQNRTIHWVFFYFIDKNNKYSQILFIYFKIFIYLFLIYVLI